MKSLPVGSRSTPYNGVERRDCRTNDAHFATDFPPRPKDDRQAKKAGDLNRYPGPQMTLVPRGGANVIGPGRCLPLLLLAPTLLGAGSAAPLPALPRFRATRLGTLPRNYVCEANDINDHGVVVGYSEGTYKAAVRWDGTLTHDLGTLPEYDGSVALAVNNAGVAVGYAEQQGKARACRFADGKVQDLGTLGKESRATAINNRGDIAGWAEPEGNKPHAVLWHAGKLTDLGLPNTIQAWISGLNDRGDLAGYVNAASGPTSGSFRAFLRHGGGTTLLDVLPGYDYAETHGINDRGDVVGAGISKKPVKDGTLAHAFLYRSGKLQDLGTLGGGYSRAYAINDAGPVVGASLLADGRSRAFLWKDGRMLDLNRCIRSNSGWSLTEARSINGKGEIVGAGYYQEQRRGFLLSPITQP